MGGKFFFCLVVKLLFKYVLFLGNFCKIFVKVGILFVGMICWVLEGGDVGVILEDFYLVLMVVLGDGREVRVGEERRRVERWDWVMIEVCG